MKKNILIIEDEKSISEAVSYALKSEGFSVQWEALGQEGIVHLKNNSVDLIVLDVGLPDISGFEVCKDIRSFSDVPVIFLTARQEEVDRVVGLEIGADDYMVKPFSPRELTARVKAVLRRSTGKAEGIVEPSNLFQLDQEKCRITCSGQMMDLTRYEFGLLSTFLSQPGRVFTREQLMDKVWEAPEASMDRTIDAHIKTLRSKLKKIVPDREFIKTHRGMGYSIEI